MIKSKGLIAPLLSRTAAPTRSLALLLLGAPELSQGFLFLTPELLISAVNISPKCAQCHLSAPSRPTLGWSSHVCCRRACPHPVSAFPRTSHPQVTSRNVLASLTAPTLLRSAAGRGMEGQGQGFVVSPAPAAHSEEHQPGFSLPGMTSLRPGSGPAEPPQRRAAASAGGAVAFDLTEHNEQHGTSGDAPSARLAGFSGERATPGRWEDDW